MKPTFIFFGNREKYDQSQLWDWTKLLSECIIQEDYLHRRSLNARRHNDYLPSRSTAVELSQRADRIRYLDELEEEIADGKHLLQHMVQRLQWILPRDALMIIKLKFSSYVFDRTVQFFADHKFDNSQISVKVDA